MAIYLSIYLSVYIYIYIYIRPHSLDPPSVGLGSGGGTRTVLLKPLQAGSLLLRCCTVRYVMSCLLLCFHVYLENPLETHIDPFQAALKPRKPF